MTDTRTTADHMLAAQREIAEAIRERSRRPPAVTEDYEELFGVIHQMAKHGYEGPGCDNWRAVEMCRQIRDLIERNT